MDEILWFCALVWMFLIALSFMIKEGKTIKIIGSVLGLILALMLLAESHIVAFLFFIVNVICLFQGASEK